MRTRVQFDILKRTSEGAYIWLEAAHDLEDAKDRLCELSAGSSDQYLIFDERTQLVVVRVESNPK
jgi:predicted choloylglycine hydrolase